MDDLETKIKNSYNSKMLSTKQLESILETPVIKNRKRFSTSTLLKYAAVFLVFISSIYSLYFLPFEQQNKIINKFATEIAFNHQKKLPPEISTNNIIELNKKLNQLNFKITLPNRITDTLKLLGGRYCSVDSRIAAQLKLENQELNIVTCYIFKKEESFDFNTKIIKDNTQIFLWNSDNLIYAIASDKN